MFGKKHHSIQRPHFAMALSITILLFCSLSLTAGANETEEQRIETFELDSYLSDATLSSASIVLHDQAQAMRGLHHIVFDIFRGVGDEDYLNVEDMRILAAVNAWNSTTCVRWHHLPKGGRAWVDDQNRRVLLLDTHKLLFVGTPGKPCRLLRRGTRTAPIFFEVLVGECGTHRLTQLLGQVLGLGAITSPEQYTMSADNMKTLTQYVPVIPWDGESVMQRPEVYFSVLSADPEQYASHIGIRQGVSKGDIWAVNFLFNSCATQPSEESSMKPKISCSSSFTDNPDFPVVVTTGQRVLIHFVGRLTAPGADVAELSHEVIANPTYESASLHTALQTRYSVSHTQVITLSWVPVHNEDAPKQTIGVKFHTLSGATEVEETCRVTFKVVEHTCFGIENSDKSKVCNGRGVCDKRDHCFCDPGYKGTQCQYSTTCPNGNLFWPLSTRPVNDSAVLAMRTEGSLGKAAQIVFEASAPNHSALMIPYGFREQFQIPELTVPQHISLYFRAAGRAAWTCQPRVILSSLNTTCSKLQLSHQGWFLDGKYIAATPNLDEWHFIEFTVNHQSKLVRVYIDGVILALARGEVYSCISKGISTLDVSCPAIMQESVEEDDFHSVVDDSSVLISQVRLSCMNVIHVDEPESRLIDSRFYHGTRKGITSNIKLSLKGVGEMYRWNLNEFRSEDLAVLSPQSKSHSVFLRNVTLGNPVSVDQSTTGESVSISVPFQAHPEKSSEHSTVISEDIWLVPSLSMFSGIIPTNTLQPTVLDISSLRFRIAGTCPSNYAWTDMRSWRYRKPQNELEGEDIVFFPAKICRHPDAHVNTCAELRRGSLDIKLPEVMAPKTFSIHFRRVHPGRTAWFDVQLKSKEVKTRTFHSSEAKFINLRVSIRNHELSIFFQGVSSAPIPYSSDESKVNHNPDSELEWDLLEIAFHEVNGDLKAMSCSLAGALNVLEEVPISIPKVSRLSISGTNVQVALPKLTCPVVNPIVRVGLGKENVFSDYVSDQPVQLLIHAGSSSIKHALLSAVTENSLPKYYWLEKTHIGSSMKQVVTRFRALDDHRVQLGVVFDGFQETVNALTLTVKGIPWYNPVQKSAECTSLAWCNHHGNPYFDKETNRCLCQCEGRFTGDRCDRCQEAFTGSSCAQCRLKGSYPDCRSCDEYCNAPRGKGTWDASGRCTCTCNAQFSGEDCSACHDSFSGPDCTQCAVGFTRRGEQCSKCLPHSLEPECNGEL